ncbi:hypothetical protein [Gordonia tangerina]|uniref:Uncharacterized protein n=1 Tax=Gordonia tangerina TaxID=2911060 RepID=A0ABS9DNX7_9ACTN|nr:hypothetical protein [Gordonia tangerina]MCF3940917.1 hypothetical protein [Gordonia tangerina]
MRDFWDARAVLAHVQQFARSRRVAPEATLAALIPRALASVDPNIVLPPVIGGAASLNMIVAMVGPSGHGKGASESAARAATNLPSIVELPIGSGEGLARTFAANSEGEQEVRAAIFSASEVDSIAAISSRTGATLPAVLRQLYSGEALGSANAQKHTRVIVPAHSYRAMVVVGVQPEAAAPLLGDTKGTAQRVFWAPVDDPDAPDVRPEEPARWNVPRTLVAGDRQTHLELPADAWHAMESHHLAKLRGENVDPLDGHKLLTRAKVAAALMVLDGRMYAISLEDWELAGVLMRRSDSVRARVEATMNDQARRANRAKARAAADREEIMAERKLQRAKEAVLRRLGRDGELATRELRHKIKADIREHLESALAELVDAEQIEEISVARGKRYRVLAGGTPVHRGTPSQKVPLSSGDVGVPDSDGVPATSGKPQVTDGVPDLDGVPPPLAFSGRRPAETPEAHNTCKVCGDPCKPTVSAHVTCLTDGGAA